MQHTPMEKSSQVKSVGYDAEAKVLEVTFRSGSTYRYKGVPPEEHEHLLGAESCGRCLNQRIKGKYEYEKIG